VRKKNYCSVFISFPPLASLPKWSVRQTLSLAPWALQIKLQPATHFTFTKWQPLDYNLLLLPSHTGTGGNSIKSRLYSSGIVLHALTLCSRCSQTHTHWLQWQNQRHNEVLQVYLLQYTRAGCIKYLCKVGHFYLDKIQNTNFRHSWLKAFISTVPGFIKRPYCLKELFS